MGDVVRRLHWGFVLQTAQRTVKRVDEVDPEEMERRAAHLRRQRDLLLMKKKKEQEERLRVFNEVCSCCCCCCVCMVPLMAPVDKHFVGMSKGGRVIVRLRVTP
jgi:hypothetical protein